MTTDETIDRLYGLPLEEFTAARNAAAKSLRKAGDREAADRILALRKPTASAGAVNRLVRRQRTEVEEFLRAAAVLRDAQFSSKGDLAAASRDERAALARLVEEGGEAVRQSLLAASVDDDAARSLLEGRLVQEFEPAGFGTLLAHAQPSGRRLTPAKKERSTPRRSVEAPRPAAGAPRPAAGAPRPTAGALREGADAGPTAEPGGALVTQPAPARKSAADAATLSRLEQAEAELERAKAELETAEEQERSARRRWDDAREEADRAREAVADALHALDRLAVDREHAPRGGSHE